MSPIVYFSFAFAFSELLLLIIKRSKPGTTRARRDSGSLIFLWIMITVGFTAGFFLANFVNLFRAGFGAVFIVTGLIIRWIAILQLGNSFTVDVAITDTAFLKTDGIYKRVRHPSYSGILSVVFGFAVTMSSLYSIIVLFIPVFIAVIYRINVEEKLLELEFGQNYINYKSNTKKLIPWIY